MQNCQFRRCFFVLKTKFRTLSRVFAIPEVECAMQFSSMQFSSMQFSSMQFSFSYIFITLCYPEIPCSVQKAN